MQPERSWNVESMCQGSYSGLKADEFCVLSKSTIRYLSFFVKMRARARVSVCVCVCVCVFGLFRDTSAAYGGSQARDPIRAIAASLCHSHSNAGSKPHLQPTP